MLIYNNMLSQKQKQALKEQFKAQWEETMKWVDNDCVNDPDGAIADEILQFFIDYLSENKER